MLLHEGLTSPNPLIMKGSSCRLTAQVTKASVAGHLTPNAELSIKRSARIAASSEKEIKY